MNLSLIGRSVSKVGYGIGPSMFLVFYFSHEDFSFAYLILPL